MQILLDPVYLCVIYDHINKEKVLKYFIWQFYSDYWQISINNGEVAAKKIELKVVIQNYLEIKFAETKTCANL